MMCFHTFVSLKVQHTGIKHKTEASLDYLHDKYADQNYQEEPKGLKHPFEKYKT